MVYSEFRKETIVIIPARNEAGTVGGIVKQILGLGLGLDTLVVDDTSTDETAWLAERAGARVLRLALPLGAWGAMQTGLRYALRAGYRWAITLDADGQHDPAAIPRLMSGLKADAVSGSKPCNVVVGACTRRGSLARQMAWWVLRRLGGFDIQDLTSGYRVYDRRAMRVVASPEATLLEYQDVGVLLLLTGKNCCIREVEVTMVPRQIGHSRVFSSWVKVLYYLSYSAILCLSRRPVGQRRIT
ncbi:MAG: glycosyltransferase family 2 protein [Pseudomonadota bacterium]